MCVNFLLTPLTVFYDVCAGKIHNKKFREIHTGGVFISFHCDFSGDKRDDKQGENSIIFILH